MPRNSRIAGVAIQATHPWSGPRGRRPSGRVMCSLISCGFVVIAVAALIATPVAARNGTGQVRTPFAGRHRDAGSYGYFAPFWTGAIDDEGGSPQSDPENAAPPTQPSPTADTPIPAAPYTPPSVEIAPGGIEIIRGPGSG